MSVIGITRPETKASTRGAKRRTVAPASASCSAENRRGLNADNGPYRCTAGRDAANHTSSGLPALSQLHTTATWHYSRSGRLQDASGPREGRRPPVTVRVASSHTDLSSAHDADTGAVLKEVVRVHAETSRHSPPISNSNTSSPRICFAPRATAMRQRSRASAPFARTPAAPPRPLTLADAQLADRPRGRLRLVAEARRRLPGARRQGVLRRRAARRHSRRTQQLLALGARAEARQRSDVRLRPARRAHRREERSDC